MTEKQREHEWVPWLYCDIFTGGMFVPQSAYFDAGGVQCCQCKHVVYHWVNKEWPDGKFERREIDEEDQKKASEGPCPGPAEILLVE